MFKLYIDKKAIDTLVEVLKKNDLTQIEVKDGKKSIKIARESIKVHNIGQGGPESNNLHNQSNASKEVKEVEAI